MNDEEKDKIGIEALAEYLKSKEDLAFAEVRLEQIGDKLREFTTFLEEFSENPTTIKLPDWYDGFPTLRSSLEEVEVLRAKTAKLKERVNRLGHVA